MKKHTFYTLCFYLALFGMVFIFLIKGYKETRKQTEKKMWDIFEKTIRIDKDERDIFPSFSFTDDSLDNGGNDSIMVVETEEGIYYVEKSRAYREKITSEREYIIDHCFLAENNPICPQSLDSLYQTLLQEENIPAQTAISYHYKGQIDYSSSDSGFYKSAQVLEPVFIGVNEDYGLTLQAYVKIPAGYILKRYFQKYDTLLFLSLITLLLSYCAFYIFNRKKIKMLPVPETHRTLLQIEERLLFDETHGQLIYEDKEITLGGYKLKLFKLLLHNKDHYLTSDSLKETLWPDGTSTKEALTQTVKRLRTELEPIPVLSIQSARNKGYRLTLLPVSEAEKGRQIV